MLPPEQIRFGFLKKLIREYYSLRRLEEPPDLHKREIALESLEDGVYIRHLSFPYMSALYEYILSIKTPLHLYYSSALYVMPDADRMENKVWEGSELLFDIDADKYEGCSEKLWICPSTGDVFPAEVDSCPHGEKPVEYSSIPWACILRAWNKALILIDILKEDLGYSKVKVYFSGNRGFHVKVLDQEVLKLSREARKAVSDYVSCSNLDFEKIFPVYRGGRVVFRSPEFGLRRRVLDYAIRHGFVERYEAKGLKELSLVSVEHVKAILAETCVDIDKAVTMDITRLSRFGNSLNMKSGLRATELSTNVDIGKLDYGSFSPFRGVVKVRSTVTANIDVMGRKMRLVRGNTYKLEAHLGVYLVIKGLALPIETSELEVRA